MARGDFHTHSIHSDGILTPRALVAKALANGVTVMALTDHDTTAGVAEALAAGKELGVRVLPGVELSGDLPGGGDAHILGYFASVDDTLLQEELAELREGRTKRGKAMLVKLAALGMPVEWERVLEIAGEAAVGRPHVAQAMVEREYVAGLREAFDRFLHTGGPADASREKLAPDAAVRLIRDRGGLAVLAHPSFLPDAEAALRPLIEAGLQGLEVYYKNYSAEEVSTYKTLADAHALIALGGSDYHGIHDDEREPGDIPLPDEAIDAFLARVASQWPSASAADQGDRS